MPPAIETAPARLASASCVTSAHARSQTLIERAKIAASIDAVGPLGVLLLPTARSVAAACGGRHHVSYGIADNKVSDHSRVAMPRHSAVEIVLSLCEQKRQLGCLTGFL